MPLERRQKILIPLIALALFYIIWQVYDMFIANDTNPPPKQIAANTTKQITATNTSPTPTAPKPPRQLPPSITTATLPTLTPEEREYLRLVNKYQMLKLQRMVTDEQAAIAEAKEKIAELDKTTAKLTGDTPTTNSNAFSISNNNFKLSYIDEQGNSASATISKNGHYYEVYKGSELNGLKITAITPKGIILRNHRKVYLLTFQGIQLLRQTTPKKMAKKTKEMPDMITNAKIAKDQRQLLSISGNYYTIQLLGTQKLGILASFIHTNKLGKKSYILKTQRQGEPWYALLYGTYLTKPQVKIALSTLNPAIEKNKPWIRKIANVQKEIYENK